MGNKDHRVNMVLITYLVVVMSSHECLTFQEDQLVRLERTSHEKNAVWTLILTAPIYCRGSTATELTVHSAWPIVLSVLTAVLSVGLLIALAVRYRFFRWCLTRNSHALLVEGETASQCGQAGDLEGEIPVRGMRGRMIRSGESSDDDDDGFIEDNYIQANEREEAKEEEIQQEDAEDSDDELVIQYGN